MNQDPIIERMRTCAERLAASGRYTGKAVSNRISINEQRIEMLKKEAVALGLTLVEGGAK